MVLYTWFEFLSYTNGGVVGGASLVGALRWGHWDFSLPKSFLPNYGPGVDSGSNRNEYQGCLLGVKAADA